MKMPIICAILLSIFIFITYQIALANSGVDSPDTNSFSVLVDVDKGNGSPPIDLKAKEISKDPIEAGSKMPITPNSQNGIWEFAMSYILAGGALGVVLGFLVINLPKMLFGAVGKPSDFS